MIGDKPSGNIVHNRVHEFMVIGDQREGERERERERMKQLSLKKMKQINYFIPTTMAFVQESHNTRD